MVHYALIGSFAVDRALCPPNGYDADELVDPQKTGRSLSLVPQAKVNMFMRNALGLIVNLFGAFCPFLKKAKNPQRFILKNNELYEYDPESRQYHPWKSSVPKR